MRLVVTTDAGVERVHFTWLRFSPEDIGWKALAVNLSDLAAAGAQRAVPLRAGRAARAPLALRSAWRGAWRSARGGTGVR